MNGHNWLAQSVEIISGNSSFSLANRPAHWKFTWPSGIGIERCVSLE